MKLLIVDDEKHVLEGLRQTIDWKTLGVDNLEFAENGQEAWDKYQKAAPDILITDMYMPKMNGIELIRNIRNEDVHIPIVILSGYDDFSYTQEAIHHRVDRYILKPSIPDEIQRELGDIINELKRKRQQRHMFMEISQQMDSSIPVLREQFLYQMLTTVVTDNDLSDTKLEFYHIDSTIKLSAVVMTVKIYRSDARNELSESEWQLFKFAVSNIIEEILSRSGHGYPLRFMDDRLTVIVYGNLPSESAAEAKAIATEIINLINDYLQLDVNIGIGQAYDNVRKYSNSYRESKDALEFVESEGINQFAASEELKKSSIVWPQYPIEQIRLLGESLLQADNAKAQSIWSEIERVLLDWPNVPFSYLQTMCMSIMSTLVMQIMESEHYTIDADRIASTLGGAQKQYTLVKLKAWIQSEIQQWVEMVEVQAKAREATPYVDHVKSVVAAKYNEKISFSQLAKELSISRNYLSHTFKMETGTSFMDYLTNYRIRKAKELLRKKQFMVYEVADKVGYPDPAYFSRMFKNVTGLSPMEYMMQET
jgi:two-component system response regulator YesN